MWCGYVSAVHPGEICETMPDNAERDLRNMLWRRVAGHSVSKASSYLVVTAFSAEGTVPAAGKGHLVRRGRDTLLVESGCTPAILRQLRGKKLCDIYLLGIASEAQ